MPYNNRFISRRSYARRGRINRAGVAGALATAIGTMLSKRANVFTEGPLRKARKLSSYSSGTQTRKAMYSNSYAAGKSISKGRRNYVKGRKGRRLNRRLSKYFKRQNVLAGYSAIQQFADSGSDPFALNVNVSGISPYKMLRATCHALFRAHLQHAGLEYDDPQLVVAQFVAASSTWTLTYRQVVGGGSTGILVNGAAGANIQNRGDDMLNAILGATIPLGSYFQESIIQWDDGSYSRLDIQDMMIDYCQKTSFKFQNRSKNDIGGPDENTDELNRCPIRYRVFYGKGACPLTRSSASDPGFLQSGGNLAVTAIGSGTGPEMRTVQQPYDWKYCTNSKDGYIQPGGIKTESLMDKIRIPFSTFVAYYRTMRAFNSNCRTPYGHFKMLTFEKIIGNGITTNINNVEIIYEGEQKCYVKLLKTQSKWLRRTDWGSV